MSPRVIGASLRAALLITVLGGGAMAGTPINSTRYLHRLQVERAVKIGGADFRLFVADEVFYDWSVDSWTRNRFAVGVGQVA
ncbi:MAG: hypothetical protein H0W76_04990 [Pyrinomonadaceae bacterium]|nr:hypothetical protein [Pyrinomonadaceae bacterium]